MWACLLLGLLAADPSAADVAVVCPAEFRPALAPWVAHRERQGHRLAFVSASGGAEQIRRGIRREAAGGKLRFVVLVGDADPQSASASGARRVPTHFVRARVVQHFGPETQIAGDNWFADLDDDHLPDVAIGRLSVDTPEQLAAVVAKIISYENSRDFGLWRRQVDFVAGVGGFGYAVDTVLENLTKQVLASGLPPAYGSSMTYASWQSPFCPAPAQFRDVAVGRLNAGCLFWVYIGHGSERHLDYVRVARRMFPIMEQADVSRLNCQNGAPIACFLACYTAAYDGPQECLAESLLRHSGGPVAVIGGSRVTMPYATSILGQGLLSECFLRRSATLGEAILAAKRQMAGPSEAGDSMRQFIETMGRILSPLPKELATERDEHLDLFNLIGDPLLRLPLPQLMTLRTAAQVEAGGELQVQGYTPIGGRCVLEIVVRRDRTRNAAPVRTTFSDTASEQENYAAAYAQANDPCWMRQELELGPGDFSASLPVPIEASGACHLRAFTSGTGGCAAGAVDVDVLASGR